MEPYIVDSDFESIPSVIFDPAANKFEMTGEARPENPPEFYVPIMEWMESYFKGDYVASGSPEIQFKFGFEYFNSSSAKFLLDIFRILAEANENGANINTTWHYDEMDDDMLATGEEFAEMTGLKIELVEIPD